MRAPFELFTDRGGVNMSNTDFEFSNALRGDARDIHAHGYGNVQIGPGDEAMRVIFYKKAVLNQMKSRAAGRPLFDTEVFVKSHMPGEERLQENDRPATDEHKRRWPRQWAAYLQNREYVPEGTPVEFLFPANPDVPGMLKWHGFHTVELLAKATPVAIESIGMGMADWIAKAKKYLEDSRKGVDHHKIKELEERHAREIKSLQNQIADLVSRLNTALGTLNDVPTGMRENPLPPKQLKPMPQERVNAAPDPTFIDEEPEPEPEPANPRFDRSAAMKERWAQKRAKKDE
jgi:hypothetical protein